MWNYRGYTARLRVDEDAEVICGKVLEINDVLTFEAKTVSEAKKEFHRTVDTYLDFCQKEGLEPEKPFSGKLPFRTTPEIHRNIYRAASRADTSINSWMEKILSEAAINQNPEESSPIQLAAKSVAALAENPDALEKLLDEVSPLLKSKGSLGLIQFVSAVEHTLAAIELVTLCLERNESDHVLHVVKLIESSLRRANNSSISESTSKSIRSKF